MRERETPRTLKTASSDVISWIGSRLPWRIPAPTILLRAKWLIIIITISYFLRSVETTKKQKGREININKSSGQRWNSRLVGPYHDREAEDEDKDEMLLMDPKLLAIRIVRQEGMAHVHCAYALAVVVEGEGRGVRMSEDEVLREEGEGARINNNYWFEPLIRPRSFESQDHK